LEEKKENRPGRRGADFEKVIAGFHFAASSEGLYVVDGQRIYHIDPVSGKQLSTFTHPDKDTEWGRLLIHDDLLIATVFRNTEEHCRLPTDLVALDKKSGKVQWTKKAKLSFPVFALGKDKLFCFDGAIKDFYAAYSRRGVVPTAAQDKFLRAIDLKTGKDLWEERTDVIATWISYSKEHDIMLVSNKEKIATFRGKTGESLWRKYSEGKGFKGHPENYWDKVILWKDQILDQRGPGLAYDMETGDPILRKNPLTGKEDPWAFTKSGHHCNYAIASEHLMTFRAGDAAFCDLETGSTA
ncbi:MAG: PQQ-binding-like beta-propeller repeat protein, partial [Methylococcales bacterium]|nr:PQQ-binding-like beta-propeller repeat protein [Methylococcales bacterium]